MKSKLTHKEHATRAMLMGRIYDWRDRTYCIPSTINGEPTITDMLDADTLEPVIDGARAWSREGSWRDLPDD